MMTVQVIRQSYIVHAPAKIVWSALLKLPHWQDDLVCETLEAVERKRLVQHMYTGKVKTPSKVHIALSEENGNTYIDLLHEDVPDDQREKINKSWKTSYFGPLKDIVENAKSI